MITLQSGPGLLPLKHAILHMGLFAINGAADDQGRVSFTSILPGDFKNRITIIEVYRQDGSHMAIHPRKVTLIKGPETDTAIVVVGEGEPWKDKIKQPHRSRFYRRARL